MIRIIPCPSMAESLTSFSRGSVALVQGASRGIGLGLVRALLADPAFDRVIATCRQPERARELREIDDPSLTVRALDVTEPDSIEAAAGALENEDVRISLLVNAAGVLHGHGFGPEKRLEDLDLETMQHVFAVNALGPALMLKSFHRLLSGQGKAVFAAISARVGSIGDNRIGGWYSYRASKAALNQFLRTAGVEFGRRHKNAIVAALHPGTTDTGLSEPFQANVPDEQLFSVDRTVGYMLSVIDGLTVDDSGGFFAWDGKTIEW
ncbi:MAG: SDR family oxidoreductase [Candidatus Wenzhouxiangella sp. M2_3B_020]